MVFSKKWLRNQPQFLLYFLIHIDVLMLYRKFELIPTSNFQVMAILQNRPIFEKYPVLYFVHLISINYMYIISLLLCNLFTSLSLSSFFFSH